MSAEEEAKEEAEEEEAKTEEEAKAEAETKTETKTEAKAEEERKGKRYFVRRNAPLAHAHHNTRSLTTSSITPPPPSPSQPTQQTQVEITMRDLENAIHTINRFASLYRRAVSAIENLERAESLIERRIGGRGSFSQSLGRFFGIPSHTAYNDPITAMLMEAVEQAVKEQAQKIVEKRAEKLSGVASVSVGEESEEVKEALEGLRESESIGERKEEEMKSESEI